jgi:hypothetical protein
MRLIITSIIIFSISGLAFSQSELANKVYETGLKVHFDNYKKCKFYFECDCCSGKFLFVSSNEYYYITYCTSDFVLTKGTYSVDNNNVRLSSDGSRIDIQYNWEREVDSDAEPAFFVRDTTISKYELNYRVDNCNGQILVREQKQGTHIAVETELLLAEELEMLDKYGLSERLGLIKADNIK